MAELTFQMKARPDLADALILLCPNAPFISNQNPDTGEYDYENVEWQTHPDWIPPTKEEVETYLETIRSEWDTNVKYQLSRKVKYPSIGEQLDSLWHAMDDGLIPKIEPMYSDIKSVKDQFPKGDPTVELVLKNDVNTFEVPISLPENPKNYNPEAF
jgi:hypothetical protein